LPLYAVVYILTVEYSVLMHTLINTTVIKETAANYSWTSKVPGFHKHRANTSWKQSGQHRLLVSS